MKKRPNYTAHVLVTATLTMAGVVVALLAPSVDAKIIPERTISETEAMTEATSHSTYTYQQSAKATPTEIRAEDVDEGVKFLGMQAVGLFKITNKDPTDQRLTCVNTSDITTTHNNANVTIRAFMASNEPELTEIVKEPNLVTCFDDDEGLVGVVSENPTEPGEYCTKITIHSYLK